MSRTGRDVANAWRDGVRDAALRYSTAAPTGARGIEAAKDLYVRGIIGLDELERMVGRLLLSEQGRT